MKLKVTRRQYNVISLSYRLSVFFFIIALLGIYAYFTNKIIEFALIFLPYFVTKNYYASQFHSKSLLHCFVLSLVIFIILTAIAVPKNYSILASAILGTATAYASHKAAEIQFKLKDYEFIEPIYNKLIEQHQRPFNIDDCSKSEFLERCKELNIPAYKHDELYDLFHMKIDGYCDKYNIQYQSANNKRLKYRKKFNKT